MLVFCLCNCLCVCVFDYLRVCVVVRFCACSLFVCVFICLLVCLYECVCVFVWLNCRMVVFVFGLCV